MKVKELVAELLKKEQDEEILVGEPIRDDKGEILDYGYYSIGDIEQWSTEKDDSHHYTIFGDELISD